MTYATQYTAAIDPAFIPVVAQASIKCAQDISSESTATTGHAARAVFALQVLRSPDLFGPIIARGVVADGTTDKNSTDIAIYNRISAIWNGYAGA